MEAIARLVRAEHPDDPAERPTTVDAYLAQVRDEQHRYIEALAASARQLDTEPGQVANVAALHARLSQQLFDAQRLILKRRADAHAAVVRITADAENEVETILRHAHERSSGSVTEGDRPASIDRHDRSTYRDDLGIWSASDGLARAIDKAFDRSADEESAARQLRALLDEWWRIENQEDQAAIDDASARAAMRVHLAEVEALEIRSLVDANADVDAATPIHLPIRNPISMPVPVLHSMSLPTISSADQEEPSVTFVPDGPRPSQPKAAVLEPRPKLDTEPILAALDAADHQGLDSILTSLLDTLETHRAGGADDGIVHPIAAAPTPIVELASIEQNNSAAIGIDDEQSRPDDAPRQPDDLRIRCDIDDLEHAETVRQEAFDRFWGAFAAVRSKPFARDWILVQVMLPAVGVIAVLALVMAWVG